MPRAAKWTHERIHFYTGSDLLRKGEKMRKYIGEFRRRLVVLTQAVGNLGLPQAVEYLFLKRRGVKASGDNASYTLHSKHARHALVCRGGTSDRYVFHQIFVQREYRCLDDVKKAGLIIDCGANCGYSAAYLLSRYPDSFLMAVEPDSSNFQALEENLKPYAGRYRVVQSGVWSHVTGLVVESNSNFGDGMEWARAVREPRDGEKPDLMATGIEQLIVESGHERVSILKVDIEGSERVVFGQGSLGWIDKIDHMVIELHGKECSDIVHAAMAGRGFSVSECEELTVFSRQ